MNILMKFILVLSCLLSHSICYSLKSVYSDIRGPVSPILITDGKPEPERQIFGSGSGVVIRPGFIVTAAHVVLDKPGIVLYVLRNNTMIQLTVVKIDREIDLALLSGQVTCPCAELAVLPLVVDQSIIAVGFPMFMEYGLQLVTPGIIQGIVFSNIATTATSAPGSSGGGVFVIEDHRYRLAGIISAIAVLAVREQRIPQPWLAFSVPAPLIREFLKGSAASEGSMSH